MCDSRRRMVSPRSLAVLACAATFASVATAHAQLPILDGNRFVPSSLVTWSFIDTEISSTSDAGTAEFAFRPMAAPLTSSLSTFDARFIAADQTVAGSLAFARAFSMSAQISASGILPRDRLTALFLGGNASQGESVGASLLVVSTDSFQATLRTDLHALEVESVIPALLPSSPRVTGHILGIRPALAAALALSRRVGLQGGVSVDLQRYDVETSDDITSVIGALAATVTLDPVPFTLLVGANIVHAWGLDVNTPSAVAALGPDQTVGNVEGGLYYTARPELDLGLVVQAEVGGGDHNNRRRGLFRLGYYF